MITRLTVACLSALLLALGLAAPANADSTVKQSKTGDLYVRAERPSAKQLELQYVAMWNPAIGEAPKLANSYRGDTPQLRKNIKMLKNFGQSYDLLSITIRATAAPAISGTTMSVPIIGTIAGFPAQKLKGHYVRDDGRWKLDWKATCAEIGGCNGNPQWGY
ncbi:hypothetical protein [Gordonia crocea]|uniref:Low molecular weight antigen MTB12-like C-terminal domain-containing protein n=1 Tax=Gordonia crocea TaxID=589162 RepID=A0A7I9UVN8_9ACTN|nr:hypothetical protein [Gordonia crocea]GED97049.1 hypothetical protein nbrc107697_10880 [Gordonia crocea]